MQTTEDARGGSLRQAAAHLFAVSSLVVAQPVLDTLRRYPEFLVAHRLEWADVLLVTAALMLVPPLAALAAVAAASAVSRRLGSAVLLACLAAGLGAGALAPLQRVLAGSGALCVALAVALGAAGALLYARSPAVRRAASAAALLSLLLPAWFLASRSVADAVGKPAGGFRPIANVRGDTPLVFLLFDALPLVAVLDETDGIDRSRFPNLAAFADEALWLRNASTVAEHTKAAVPALLDGRYVSEDVLPGAEQFPRNLFLLLGGAYQMHVTERFTALCPRQLCDAAPRSVRMRGALRDLAVLYANLVVPADLREGIPGVRDRWKDFGAEAEHEAEDGELEPLPFRRFLAGLRAREGRVFHFLHLLAPHPPWDRFASGRRYGPVESNVYPDGTDGLGWVSDDTWKVDRALQRHLLQVGFADHLVGRLVAELRATGLWDTAVIVIAADHGESVRPGHLPRRVDDENAVDVLNVPLLIRAPGLPRGVVSDRNVETVDLVPTLAGLLDFDLPGAVDGRSFLDPSVPEKPTKTVYHRPHRYAWQRLELPPRFERAPAVSRIWARFGRRGAALDVFAIGPHRELLGRPLDALAPLPAEGWRTALREPDAFDAVDLASGYLPAHVAGRLLAPDGDARADAVAIAVNGRIEAVVETSRDAPGRWRFAALVPEDAFRAGRNDVAVLVVDDAGAGATLRATRLR